MRCKAIANIRQSFGENSFRGDRSKAYSLKDVKLKKFIVAVLLALNLLTYGAGRAAAQAASTTTPALQLPEMLGPLTNNPNPFSFDLEHFGKIYLTGAVSELFQWQTHPESGDSTTQVDVSNAQIFIQKPEGFLQFYVQTGFYSQPSLGTAYVNAINTISDLWGPVPLAFITLAPTQDWSIEVGKLSALSGLEQTFTFQNMNIERGLLWNQSNSVNRGVQINHSIGPFSLALSWNDGFYSDRYTWLSGSLGWNVNSSDTLSLSGAGNAGTTTFSHPATPLFQNNSEMFNLDYTHTSGPWSVMPYLNFTYVPRTPRIGLMHYGSTYGAAMLGSYAFDSASKVFGFSMEGLSLPLRVEYIFSTGSASDGAPNLLYGAGSAAWSVTFTPTYQYKRFFIRPEFSFVGANHAEAGAAFGPDGNNTTQTRALLEWGFLF
jgi:hypothetical protein